jgi:6-phosphogluconolactonase
MPDSIVTVCRDPDDLARRAADLLVETARTAIGQRGRFTVALSGGSTPEKCYTLLAGPEYSGQIDWTRTLLFFGDERFVPHHDSRSNYALARRTLLDLAPIPAANLFPVPTDRPTPGDSARDYAATLARAFAIAPDGPPPRFDLILLGLGDDGHTASLFPGANALNETRAWVASSPPGVLPPPVDRVTFTYPVLNAARHVAFLVAGAKKADIFKAVLEGNAGPAVHPAAGVRPTKGALTWLVDTAAAARLNRG